jgi:hypothetical protein
VLTTAQVSPHNVPAWMSYGHSSMHCRASCFLPLLSPLGFMLHPSSISFWRGSQFTRHRGGCSVRVSCDVLCLLSLRYAQLHKLCGVPTHVRIHSSHQAQRRCICCKVMEPPVMGLFAGCSGRGSVLLLHWPPYLYSQGHCIAVPAPALWCQRRCFMTVC